jgi:glucosyl-dolichyl phosphate glucuronosyltransferase
MAKIVLSVIVPTHNRSDMLQTVINSLKFQTYQSEAYEIIIVDNASGDDTHVKAMEFVQEIPPVIHYLYEPRLGISHARNCGAMAARGEIIVFIDDDAIAEPGWLSAYATSFSSDPDIVCVGGKSVLWWENERPSWFGIELEGYLGGNSILGDQKRSFLPDQFPFGNNMAIQKKAFLAVPGGFDSSFGHTGTQLGAHDETRIIDHLRDMGKIIYEPEACIQHFTPAERATRRYLIRRSYQIGKADAVLDQQRQNRTRFGLIKTFLANSLFLFGDISQWAYHLVSGKKEEATYRLIITSSRIGRLIRTSQLVFQN